uniref:Ovule protein n=1 Tax=Steinernema glaseri TaxID=37863 RepID=A0A1I8A025_9BILA
MNETVAIIDRLVSLCSSFMSTTLLSMSHTFPDTSDKSPCSPLKVHCGHFVSQRSVVCIWKWTQQTCSSTLQTGHGGLLMSLALGFGLGAAFGAALVCLHIPFTNIMARKRAKEMEEKNSGKTCTSEASSSLKQV